MCVMEIDVTYSRMGFSVISLNFHTFLKRNKCPGIVIHEQLLFTCHIPIVTFLWITFCHSQHFLKSTVILLKIIIMFGQGRKEILGLWIRLKTLFKKPDHLGGIFLLRGRLCSYLNQLRTK